MCNKMTQKICMFHKLWRRIVKRDKKQITRHCSLKCMIFLLFIGIFTGLLTNSVYIFVSFGIVELPGNVHVSFEDIVKEETDRQKQPIHVGLTFSAKELCPHSLSQFLTDLYHTINYTSMGTKTFVFQNADPRMALMASPETKVQNKSGSDVLKYFCPLISSKEFHIFVNLFNIVTTRLTEHGLDYILYGGSLIGSYRHHSLVPWDDDIDLWLNFTQIDRVKQVLSSIPGVSLYNPNGIQWKVQDNSIHRKSRFSWPYLDIFFYKENKSHIWDFTKQYSTAFSFEKSRVFPLQKRPFLGGMHPCPCHSEAVLSRNYNSNFCTTTPYSHKGETPFPRSRKKIVRCSELYDFFPFVFRKTNPSGTVTEQLKIGNSTLYEINIPLPCT